MSCARLFEVEALRDGRLDDSERASFEEHLARCLPCTEEQERLDALARALREGPPVDELHVRRERTRLLAAFDDARTKRSLPSSDAPQTKTSGRWLPGIAAAVALVVVVGLVAFRKKPVPVAGEPPKPTIIRAETATVWSKPSNDKIVLDHGALWIQASHVHGEPPLVIALPDGELEDTGTIFTVAADGGHTTRVAVEEGVVILRLHGKAPVRLGAGDTWQQEESPPIAAKTPPPSRATSLGSTTADTVAAPVAKVVKVADDASAFRDAMSLLDRGDNEAAARAFATFLATHPNDAHAEDASYLRVIALQRVGDEGRMKTAAGDYLRRYPAGFRRAEVEALTARR